MLVTSTADRPVVFSAPSPANTSLTATQDAADRAASRPVVFSAPNPASTNLTAIKDADRAAAFAVRFTPPA